jgi:hypothetical protein
MIGAEAALLFSYGSAKIIQLVESWGSGSAILWLLLFKSVLPFIFHCTVHRKRIGDDESAAPVCCVTVHYIYWVLTCALLFNHEEQQEWPLWPSEGTIERSTGGQHTDMDHTFFCSIVLLACTWFELSQGSGNGTHWIINASCSQRQLFINVNPEPCRLRAAEKCACRTLAGVRERESCISLNFVIDLRSKKNRWL